jgi:two-component system, NtrC family, sensor kinase
VKLALKMMAAFMAAIVLLVAVHTYLTVLRDIDLFDREMKRDAHLLGSFLALRIAEIWPVNGLERALQLIEDVNVVDDRAYFRWVWLDAPPGDLYAPQASKEALDPVRKGEDAVFRGRDRDNRECLFTYVPVDLKSERMAALEVKQPLAPMLEFARETVARKVVLVGAMLLICSLLVFWLGASMVGRPVQSLVEQARRIASGDLTGEMRLTEKKDEIASLSNELNTMFEQLRDAEKKLAVETARRIDAIEQLHHTERLATVGKLASGLAHELGTPLNVVSGRAQMIAAQDLSEADVVQYAKIIREQADRMTGIVQQLLAYSRRHTPRKVRTDIRACVDRVLTVLRQVAEEKRVRFSVLGRDVRHEVNADSTQIEQVLTNLVMNSIQAMPEGGNVEVSIGMEQARPIKDKGGTEQACLCLKVRDEGVGISKEALAHIFEPFYTTKGSSQGTGLGLSIAQDIVQDHGGWIVADSEPGKGACFSVYLPMEVKECSAVS